MALTYENNRVTGFKAYAYKESLKFLGCKWDKDNKSWFVPIEYEFRVKHFIEITNQKEKELLGERWKKACEACNVEFVKKGTEEYNKVMEVFKNTV